MRPSLLTQLAALVLLPARYSDGSSDSSSYKDRSLPDSFVRSNVNITSLVEESVLFRGGAGRASGGSLWWQSLFARPEAYREALEDQITWLEQQMRQVMEEKRLVQSQAKKVKRMDSLRQSGRNTSANRELKLLEEEYQELDQGKVALEEMLQDHQRKVEHLTALCRRASDKRAEMQKDYESQVQSLEQELHHQTQTELERLERLLQQRIKDAQERARQQVLDQAPERINQATAALTAEFAQQIQEERKQTQDALSKQRLKMRSLAKAMALREKKLARQQKNDQETAQRQQATRDKVLRKQKKQVLQQQRQSQQVQPREDLEQQRQRLQDQRKSAKQAMLKEQEQKLQQKTTPPVPNDSSSNWPLSKLWTTKIASTKHVGKSLPNKSSRPTVSNKETRKTPLEAPVACWQRRVPWQPLSLPPNVKVTF